MVAGAWTSWLRRFGRRNEPRREGVPAAFEDGASDVLDRVACEAIVERPTELEIDGRLSRVIALTALPRHADANWLGRLLDGTELADLSLHIEPIDSAQAVRRLHRQAGLLAAGRNSDARRGRVANTEMELAYADNERTRDALQRGVERLFRVAVYVRVHAADEPGLDRATAHIEGTLQALLAETRGVRYEQLEGLQACMPQGIDPLGRRRNVDSSTLAMMQPFTASSLPAEPGGMLYGTSIQNGGMVIYAPFGAARANANKVVIGGSGKGKSFGVKIEALRAQLAGVDYLVIDPEGEYARLAERLGGQVVRLGRASGIHINPFDLPQAEGAERADVLPARIRTLLGLLGLMIAESGQHLTRTELAQLDQALYETYARAGITLDPETHDRTPPLLADLQTLLAQEPETASMALRLARYSRGSLGALFSAHTTAALGARSFVVFETRGLEEEERPLATFLLADHIWREVGRAPRPRLLVIDEAWQLMRRPEGAAFIAQLARQARKHYLGLITITQDARDFLGSPDGQTVVANADTKLLMGQDASTIDAVAAAFELTDGERNFLLRASRGEGLLIMPGMRVPLRVDASPLEYELATTNPAELAAQAAQPDTAFEEVLP